jgi:hypothetical protein
MLVQKTVNDDASAEFTITVDGVDHKFSAAPDGRHASLSYEESQYDRGVRRVSEPSEDVWKALIQSEEMTAYLEQYDMLSVRHPLAP